MGAPKKKATKKTTTKVKLLSGGNPQIAKADGDAPVQAYIAAMPDWKHDIGRDLDRVDPRTVWRIALERFPSLDGAFLKFLAAADEQFRRKGQFYRSGF